MVKVKKSDYIDATQVMKILNTSYATLLRWHREEKYKFPRAKPSILFSPSNKLWWSRAEILKWNKEQRGYLA